MKFNIEIDTDKYFHRFSRSVPTDFFPPTQSLLNLPIVKATIGILFSLAVGMAINIIYTTKGLKWSFNATGYQCAADLFKAPIGMAFLAIPLLALLASNHRSVQTMRQMNLTTNQIEVATGQNLFANYYKHVEEFSKWCDHIKGTGEVLSKRKLHKRMFPEAREGRFKLAGEFCQEYLSYVESFRGALEMFSYPNGQSGAVGQMIAISNEYARTVGLKSPIEAIKHEGRLYKEELMPLPSDGIHGFFKEQFSLIRAVDELLSFDTNYESDPQVTEILRINLMAAADKLEKDSNIRLLEFSQ